MEVTVNYNGQMVSVEVTEEVYAFLDYTEHKEENLAHEQRRRWDGREFDEYIILAEGCIHYTQSPEEYLCHKETIQEIRAALALCTAIQRHRFLLYALEDLSYAEIGQLCGCAKVTVYESIEAVRKKCRKFLTGYPNDQRFSG